VPGGGWILDKINGTQAEYVRVPFDDLSTYRVPAGVADGSPSCWRTSRGCRGWRANGGVGPSDVCGRRIRPDRAVRDHGARLFSPSHRSHWLADSRLDAASIQRRPVNNGRKTRLRDPLTDGLAPT
jgi:alcohol dehydrogenase